MKFAAIDIGSNAIRLLFINVYEHKGETLFQKDSLIRVPVRLGEESFLDGKISPRKVVKVIQTMKAFRELMNVHEVIDFRACATSAMREAANAKDIIAKVKVETGINIEVISGNKEAKIIGSTKIPTVGDSSARLFVDVGGGSTEITLIVDEKTIKSHSFPIGTLRILNNLVEEKDWQKMAHWLEPIKQEFHNENIYAVGSGGNINKLVKMYGKTHNYLSINQVKAIHKHLTSYTINERIKVLGLKPDRADVIVPATEIYRNVMQWSDIRRIYVPQIGLADGMIKDMYREHVRR